MPTVSLHDATEKLAQAVEKAKPNILPEIYVELFPREPKPTSPVVKELAEHIRHGLGPDEVPDLWRVVFPGSRNVWYNEETNEIHYNEELIGSVD